MVMKMGKLQQIKVKLYVCLAVLLVTGAGICIYRAVNVPGHSGQPAPTQYAQQSADENVQKNLQEAQSSQPKLQETGSVAVPAAHEQEPAVDVQSGDTLEPASDQTTYTLAVADGCLRVYVLETGTLYMETTIVYDLLPEEVRAQIDAGKQFDSEETLLEFLESYSS